MKRVLLLAGTAAALILLAAGCGPREFELKIEFDEAHGLVSGDPVMVRGVEIGQVRSISLTPDNQVVVTAVIAPEHCERLTTRARFQIRPAGKEADSPGRVLAVDPGSRPGEPLDCGATVVGQPFSGQPLVDQAAETLRQMVSGARQSAALLLENLEEVIGDEPAARLRERVQELRRAAGRTAGQEMERLRREELPAVMEELHELVLRLRREGRPAEADQIVETLSGLARQYRLAPTPNPAPAPAPASVPK